MRYTMILSLIVSMLAFISCETYESPDPGADNPDSLETKKLYVEQYDAFADKGQYWFPQQKAGSSYWIVTNATSNDNTYDDNSLRNHLLAESIIGLTALAVNEGRSETMVWTADPNSDYTAIRERFDMTYNGTQTTWELLNYHDNVKRHIKGYVLCDVRRQESITAATIAAHVHESVIIDKAYEDSIQALGYEMTWDASGKSLEDAWGEFKDACSNEALVFMPTLTGNNRSYAIAHRLMAANYNKKFNTSIGGNNATLLDEIYAWLEPLSPVLGWEQGLGEDTFVSPISRHGNMMVPGDWLWNTTMTSAEYADKQGGRAQVANPQFIEYDQSKDYASFFLSDGDNVQWMMNGFRNDTYYLSPHTHDVNMSFGIPLANLSMLFPYQLERILSEQLPNSTLIEYGGGGYVYPDNYGEEKDRGVLLNQLAEKVGHHMRQHRVPVLGLLCQDVTSAAAKEAYQAYISANDQLVGVIAVQYNPYAGGEGEVMWFTNAEGYDIPVVTARYSIWNHGARNLPNQGTPTYIASKLNELSESNEGSTHSLVAVHAWSRFKDIGDSNDPLEENIGGSKSGVEPVTWCKDKLNENFEVVNVEELLWQLRMKEKPQQTEEIRSTYY